MGDESEPFPSQIGSALQKLGFNPANGQLGLGEIPEGSQDTSSSSESGEEGKRRKRLRGWLGPSVYEFRTRIQTEGNTLEGHMEIDLNCNESHVKTQKKEMEKVVKTPTSRVQEGLKVRFLVVKLSKLVWTVHAQCVEDAIRSGTLKRCDFNEEDDEEFEEGFGNLHTLKIALPQSNHIDPHCLRRKIAYHLLKEELDPYRRMQPNLHNLSNSLYLKVFEYLDIRTIVRIFKVCRSTHSWSDDAVVWRSIAFRDFPEAIPQNGREPPQDPKSMYIDFRRRRRLLWSM